MNGIGARRWAFAAGRVPLQSRGPEPLFTSRDEFALLNTGDALANVRLTVLYARREPVGPYRVGVAPRRLRRLRVNDLIFPEAVRLGEPYALLFESDRPVVVQCARQDTRRRENAGFCANAWGE
ncbi:sensory rhodopsin transducer [Vulcaniibacterium tengchongense]|uniref:Sensory rhodopsin transducer n=1 Tax=Vulcaniibacterium tengchongense TaxID=1273429 RepID=A0A3N4VSX7_9GAMM|nr:sensory rhodopsin transducer [Vulcaniibacterium tengchongense]RPE76910.1 hypothetical protein EDC50_2162 [Vulcaniibacterium tengchongense]